MEVYGLPANLISVLRAAAAEAGNFRIALVGGIVRDTLLQGSYRDPHRDLSDIDLVVEGSATALAHVLQRRSQMLANLRFYQAYDAVSLVFEGFLLDLATARTETYPVPGCNPVTTPGSLENDLARRDFRANAMALDLSSGQLIDPHHGYTSLLRRELEFLHSHSVTDDPTRIVRAARYAARLGFKLTASSRSQINTTLNSWPWSWHQGDSPAAASPALAVRLRMELELLFYREPTTTALQLLQQWGALKLLDLRLQFECDWPRRLRCARWLGLNPLLAYIVAASKPLDLAARLQLPIQQQRLLLRASLLQHRLRSSQVEMVWRDWRPSQWCRFLEGFGTPADAVALCACLKQPWAPVLRRWFWHWRLYRSPQSSHQLLAQGWMPGAKLGAELQRRRLMALDRKEDQ